MPAVHHRRAGSRDEELGKRDDDFRPRSTTHTPSLIASLWRMRRRRLVLAILGLAAIYLFIHNIPTDLPPIDERFGKPLRPGHVVHTAPSKVAQEPAGAPPRSVMDGDEEEGPFYYNGPIKFYRLATTLRGIARTAGGRYSNRNVLFAVSSLRSAANLMPMACEMAKVDRNYVHMALLGRDPLPLEEVLEINGVDKVACPVSFHDARGDFAQFSSEARAEHSVAGALKHINDFMHPQAIIMDDSSEEDPFFIRAIRKKAAEYMRALIEVPTGRYEDFLWMTRLDSGSLGNWFSPSIDIVIHAPLQSSGGLIRLLKSLQNADYTGLRPPRLTIELPNDIEHFARQYIESLSWPPDEKASPLRTNALSLRHRIQTSKLNSEQASLRFVESFFPSSNIHDHVLILSSQTEVHPLYLQYLYYHILEYRYSSYADVEADNLLGLSLAIPTSFLNGSTGFTPPIIADMQPIDDPSFTKLDISSEAPFLYQAPSASATLIFGDKWTTFHNFLSRRLALSAAGKSEKHTKQVSESQPAWLEYLLELLTARAWNVLHPAHPFATVHSELAAIPEEYLRTPPKPDANGAEPPISLPDPDEPFLLADPAPALPLERDSTSNPSTIETPLLNLLPFSGELTDLAALPHVYRNGKLFTTEGNAEFQSTYVKWFRRHIGGCDDETAAKERVVNWLGADDLYCIEGVPMNFVEVEIEVVDEEGAKVEKDEVEDEDDGVDEKDEVENEEAKKPAAEVKRESDAGLENESLVGGKAGEEAATQPEDVQL